MAGRTMDDSKSDPYSPKEESEDQGTPLSESTNDSLSPPLWQSRVASPLPDQFPVNWLDKSDRELGELVLDFTIMAIAERGGFDASKHSGIPADFPETARVLILNMEAETAENDWLEVVLKLAARGNFAKAGSRMREHMNSGAQGLVLVEGIPDMIRGRKVRQGGLKGHETKYGDPKEKREEWTGHLTELSRVIRQHPNIKSKSRLMEIAASRRGVSSKTIQRALARNKEQPFTANPFGNS
jgi:hypothetical protein